MYKTTIVAALAAIAFTTSFAQQSESTTPGTSKQDTDKRWREMQEHMNQMHTQMEEIQKTKDPKQREKLMQEHMQSMREHMSMMHDTGGCMMMHPKGRANHAGSAEAEREMGCGMMREPDAKRREQLQEDRMDMVQMMMEQMMQHQDAMQQKQK